jgi:hypothetical protein
VRKRTGMHLQGRRAQDFFHAPALLGQRNFLFHSKEIDQIGFGPLLGVS